MTKYEITRNSVDIPYKRRFEIKPGVTLLSDDLKLIKSYDTLNEAKRELAAYKTRISKFSDHGMTFFRVEEYFIEENIYAEDGTLETSGDYCGMSEIVIELTEKSAYEILATFNNMEDAETAYNNYDGEYEVYLSY